MAIKVPLTLNLLLLLLICLFCTQSDARGRKIGPAITKDAYVSLEQIYNGTQLNFSIMKQVLCDSCNATGFKDGKTSTCQTCRGQGVTFKYMYRNGHKYQMQYQCDKCRGRGIVGHGTCPRCNGSRVYNRRKDFTFYVRPGLPDHFMQVYKGEANEYTDASPGEVRLVVHTDRHNVFTREGNNLSMAQEISLEESIFGFSRSVKHLDNRMVSVKKSTRTQPDDIFTLRGEGMPLYNQNSRYGDLNVHLKVKFPSRFTEKQKELIKMMFPDE